PARRRAPEGAAQSPRRYEPLRQEWKLEEEHVPALVQLAQGPQATPHSRGVRHVQDREPAHALRMPHGEVPCDVGAPVVSHYIRAIASQRGDQIRRIAYEELDAVGGYAVRLAGTAIPAQVGSDGAKAGGRERRQLIPPGEPALGKTVHQDHQGAVPWTDGGAMQPHVPRPHVEVLDSFELHGVHSSGDVRILGGYAAGA